jgi:outer membrane protein TolC
MILASLALLETAAAHAGEARRPPLTYETFVEAVAARHPERAIDLQTLAKSKEAERRAGLLPDPQLSVSRDEVPLKGRLQKEPEMAEAAKDGAEWQLQLSQSFPWPGTLSAEERAAKARVATTEADTGLAALMRRFEASELFLRLVRTAKLIYVERANSVVVNGLRDFSHEKFKQGIGSHMDFLQSHSEAGVLKANVATLELDLRNLKRHALALMDDSAAKSPDDIQFVLEWPLRLIKETEPAKDAAADLARERIVRAKDAELARQDAEYRRSLPSFMASGMLMQEDGGMRMYGAMVGVTVPVYSNIQRSSLSAERGIIEGRTGSELSWHDRRKALALAQAEDRIVQIEANFKALRQEIIPPVREHIEAATAQFAQGRGDIAAIIDGRRTLLNLQLTEIRTTEALALARLSVEKVKAGLIDDALDLEVPQLVGAASSGMSMGGGASRMQEMPAMKRKMPMKGGMPSQNRAPGSDMTMPEEEESKSGGSGMGM